MKKTRDPVNQELIEQEKNLGLQKLGLMNSNVWHQDPKKLALNALHNLERDECALGLREAQRVSKDTFITVDAYSNEQERIDMDAWNLTALTFMHVDEWKTFFKEEGYSGDYYWFIP